MYCLIVLPLFFQYLTNALYATLLNLFSRCDLLHCLWLFTYVSVLLILLSYFDLLPAIWFDSLLMLHFAKLFYYHDSSEPVILFLLCTYVSSFLSLFSCSDSFLSVEFCLVVVYATALKISCLYLGQHTNLAWLTSLILLFLILLRSWDCQMGKKSLDYSSWARLPRRSTVIDKIKRHNDRVQLNMQGWTISMLYHWTGFKCPFKW
jgi:hypothetical protein